MQAAFKVARASLFEYTSREPEARESQISEDWLEALAAEISTLRRRALLATVADHASSGSYALFENGVILDSQEFEGDEWEAGPDRALAAFAEVADASVQACHRDPWFDEGDTTWLLVADESDLLELPREVEAHSLQGFEHEIL